MHPELRIIEALHMTLVGCDLHFSVAQLNTLNQELTTAVKDNERNGRGKQTWPCGQVYEGEFKDGKYCGQGTMTYADGRRKSGTWRDDKFLG